MVGREDFTVNNKLGRIRREAVLASLEACRHLCEGTQEAIKICEDVRFWTPDLNIDHHEHETGVVFCD
jgi:hypothetical protein